MKRMKRRRVMNRAKKLKNKADQRVREITTQAKTVFLKKGYSASTMEEIAKLAGVSKGTVYLYFKNKDDLYVSLILAHFEQWVRLMKEFRERFATTQYSSAWEVLDEFYQVFMALYLHDPDAIRITQTYVLGNIYLQVDEKRKERIFSLAREARLMSVEILSECGKRGILPKLNHRQLTTVLTGTFLGIVQLENQRFRLSGKDHMADTLNLCFSLIAEGLAKGKERRAIRFLKKTTNRESARRK
jgi:AcrR family transcriptional regulator